MTTYESYLCDNHKSIERYVDSDFSAIHCFIQHTSGSDSALFGLAWSTERLTYRESTY